MNCEPPTCHQAAASDSSFLVTCHCSDFTVAFLCTSACADLSAGQGAGQGTGSLMDSTKEARAYFYIKK